MEIKKIYLNDFKCFKDIELELSRITILTGANSSGKSSLIQSILAPLQSSEFPLHLSTNGKYVNLGDFEDISYMHDEGKIMHLDYVITDENEEINIKTSWKNSQTNRLPQLETLYANTSYYNLSIIYKDEKYNLIFKYNPVKDPKKSANSRYELTQELNRILFELVDKKNTNKSKTNSAEKLSKSLEEKFNKNNKVIKLSAKDIDGLKRQISEKGSFVLEMELKIIIDAFAAFEKSFNYISSFRYNPQRIRFEVAKTDLKVGRYGENYEDQIVVWELKKSKEFTELCKIMIDLRLFIDIKVKRVQGGNYHLSLKIHDDGAFSSITDVGFGISQFLPILVADVQLGNQSTLIVSQPEIHLHPSVQSDFGDYLCTKIKETKKNYIIETHSEYLLNKLRLLVVNGKLKKEDLKIHYLNNNGTVVKHYEIDFDETGQILNAPSDFFETYMTDVLNIALNS